MKVLFIGGTGTLSNSCSELAVEKGMELWLLNRGHRMHRMPKNVNFIKADINNEYQLVSEALAKHQWDCVVDWIVFTPDQALRDIELFRGKTKHYFFISSASVYREPPLGQRISESDPTENPIWPYAQNKLKCEQVFLKESERNQFPVTIIRPSQAYCEFTIPTNIPGLGYGLVERLINGNEIIVHNDGLSIWTLIHSTDFAVGLVGLMGREDAIGEIFNITTSETLTWLKIFETYANYLNVTPKFVFIPSSRIYELDREIGQSLLGDKDKNMAYNNGKIKKFVEDYEPKISFTDGISRSLNWHMSNKDKIYYEKAASDRVDRIIELYKSKR